MEISTKEADDVFTIVDVILKQAIGEKASLLIYKYMENRYALRPTEFATKIDVFAEGLESFLSSGASLIEDKILEEICSRGGMNSKIKSTKTSGKQDFASQVRFAMQSAKTVSLS